MRVTVKLEASGSTLDEILSSLEKEWQDLSKEKSADLPLDSEIIVEKNKELGTYSATCLIRSKKDK